MTSSIESRISRARVILASKGRTPFEFQAHAAARCLEAIDSGGRLLIEAPTGSGKTLITQLAVGMLAQELNERLPRVLAVVPSRGLLHQHVEDAAWLGPAFGLAIHRLDPDAPMSLFQAIIRGFGVVHTTPITLTNRLPVLSGLSPPAAHRLLASFDAVIFDEIDTYLTVDELRERKDIWPAVRMCCDARLPVLGFTGTHLTETQEAAWRRYGFTKIAAAVPANWLPFTQINFVPVQDDTVRRADKAIRDRLRRAYRSLERASGPVTWNEIKSMAQGGDAGALRVLGLCAERLRLFESPEHIDAKLAAIVSEAVKPGPTLLLARFRDTARVLERAMPSAACSVVRADGSMKRPDIGVAMDQFRSMTADAQGVLVITRELGGRGLDFPFAARVVVASPRSNHQAVAQELARIRSRKSAPKRASIMYFSDTEEHIKALRLARHLAAEMFGDFALFDVKDMPPDPCGLKPCERPALGYQRANVAA